MTEKKEQEAVRSKYQTFDTVEIHRREILNAEYNPRIISEKSRKKLKKILQKHGLVAPITWNKRTGRIVGGHQRISILDDLHRGDNYRLTVAQVDVDEKEEATLNVILNNQANQGEFDISALEGLADEFDLSFIEDMGFETEDLAIMGLTDSPFEPSDEVKEEAERTSAGIAKASKSIRANQKTKDSGDDYQASTDDYMLCLTFDSEAQKHRFCDRLRVAKDQKFVAFNHMREMFNKGYFEKFFDTDCSGEEFHR
jgi:hypothetical protein